MSVIAWARGARGGATTGPSSWHAPPDKGDPSMTARLGRFSAAPVRAAFAALAALSLLIAFAGPAHTQAPISPPDDDPYRTTKTDGFHIIGNIYGVGETLHLINYLITTPEGHILIDAAYEESVPRIRANIERLGFRTQDIRFLIATHAHSDHVAGFARMRELAPNATIVAGRRDVEVIESGGVTDFRANGERQWTPVTVGQVVDDGDVIRLGGTVLTAHMTPGHTKGCTTWTMTIQDGGRPLNVILFCGTNLAEDAMPLIGNPKYPEMAADFAASYAKLKSIPVDVWLGAHGYWFGLEEKLARRTNGGANPFIDPEGYRRAILGLEQTYLDRLNLERGRR
jgi:metallo-beta-lactamase class B